MILLTKANLKPKTQSISESLHLTPAVRWGFRPHHPPSIPPPLSPPSDKPLNCLCCTNMLRRLSKKEAWQLVLPRNCVCSPRCPLMPPRGLQITGDTQWARGGWGRGGGSFKGLTVSTLPQVLMLLIRGGLALKILRDLASIWFGKSVRRFEFYTPKFTVFWG